MTQKILTVFGATGKQGGSVINAILSHPSLSKEYQLRGVTRNPSNASLPKSVEVVQADMNDPASLRHALTGSYAVFGVTDYWATLSKDIEIQQGKNIANAAKATGVQHLIWSGSTNVSKITNGAISDCVYFDSKAEVQEYIEEIKGDMVATYVIPAVFMQMFKGEILRGLGGLPIWPKPWDLNETRVPIIDAADSGLYVAGVLAQDPRAVNGARIRGVSQWMSPKEMMDILSETIGTEVRFVHLDAEEYRKILPDRIAPELVANMVWMYEYGFFGQGAEMKQTESDWVLGDMKLASWEQFIKKNGPWKW